METKEPSAEFYTALSAAQAEFPDIPKDRTAEIRSEKGNYTYKYADLATVLRVTRPALAKHGFALAQPIGTNPAGNGWQMTTILAHRTGQMLQFVLNFVPSNRMQDTGSTITYLRRYSVQSILGVFSEDDDDANHMTAAPRQQAQQRPPQNQNPQARPNAQAAQRSTAGLPRPRAETQPGQAASRPAPPQVAAQQTAAPAASSPPLAWGIQGLTMEDAHNFQKLCARALWTGPQVVQYISARFQRKLVNSLTFEQFTMLWDVVEKQTFLQAMQPMLDAPRTDPTAQRYEKELDPQSYNPSFDAEIRGVTPGAISREPGSEG